MRAIDKIVKLSVSVQADYAWGRLIGNGTYVGIAQDFADFPFIEELGVSSYPYFDFSKPEEIPLDYYSKLMEGKSLPIFISEGGWTSATFTGPNKKVIEGNPASQQNYITLQSKLLDKAQAIAVFQLVFTDIDVSSLPNTIDPSIEYYSHLGLVDLNLQPKPSLNAWDDVFKRSLQ